MNMIQINNITRGVEVVTIAFIHIHSNILMSITQRCIDRFKRDIKKSLKLLSMATHCDVE